MIVSTKFENNKAIVVYEFSEEDLNILKHLKRHGWMEFYRGYNSAIADNLYDYGFVTSDDDAWHFTIVLTKLGEEVVKGLV